jgi:hypothetical protein
LPHERPKFGLVGDLVTPGTGRIRGTRLHLPDSDNSRSHGRIKSGNPRFTSAVARRPKVLNQITLFVFGGNFDRHCLLHKLRRQRLQLRAQRYTAWRRKVARSEQVNCTISVFSNRDGKRSTLPQIGTQPRIIIAEGVMTNAWMGELANEAPVGAHKTSDELA